MKRREVGELFAKILGLFLIYCFIHMLDKPFYALLWFGRRGDGYYYSSLTLGGLIVVLLVLGWLCLFRSKWAGRLLYPEDPEEKLIDRISVGEANVMVLSTIGLILIVTGAVDFFQQAIGYFMYREQMSSRGMPPDQFPTAQYLATIFGGAAQSVLGIIVLSRARVWSKRLLGRGKLEMDSQNTEATEGMTIGSSLLIDVQVLVFCSIGIVLLIMGIVGTIQQIVTCMSMLQAPPAGFSLVWYLLYSLGTFVLAMFGLALLLFARRLATRLLGYPKAGA